MIRVQSEIPSTQAVIQVIDFDANGNQLTSEFVDTVAFTYSSDMMQLGDPFSVAVPNPKGIYTNKLKAGSRCTIYLRNPDVAANVKTLKATGLIVKRRVESTESGTSIHLECADLGWHLVNNTAPLWAPLSGNFINLLQDGKWIDPSWGINTKDFRTQNQNNKFRLNNAKAGVQLAQQQEPLLTPLQRIQSEPGDKVADIIITYARRLNYLVNVSCDGVFQLFRPNYTQETLYHIEYHQQGESSAYDNNILSASVETDISTIWTNVICVGEIVIPKVVPDAAVVNATQNSLKFRGQVTTSQKEIPFEHRMTFSDGEIFNSEDAAPMAYWKYKNDKFNAFKANYRVRGHHQNGIWWESDTMCSVNDTVNGVIGNYYVARVNYTRDEQGDLTEISLRLPNLLEPYFNKSQKTQTIRQKNGIYLIKAKV